jgi:hypothetical protein
MDDYEKYMAGLCARAEAARRARTEGKEVTESGKERPDFYQRTREREGNSPFSGGWAGGGTWAGRSR